MRTLVRCFSAIFLAFLLQSVNLSLFAQSAGNSGTLRGTVTDGSGAVIPGATVSIRNPVSGFFRETKSGAAGQYQFTDVPLNPYHLVVAANGFANSTTDVDISSFVPVTLKLTLNVGAASTTVTVEGSDLIENDSTFHTDVDRDLFAKVPLESQSSSLSSLVTLASPGVAA